MGLSLLSDIRSVCLTPRVSLLSNMVVPLAEHENHSESLRKMSESTLKILIELIRSGSWSSVYMKSFSGDTRVWPELKNAALEHITEICHTP